MTEHIVIHTDKDLRILDWTPFKNYYSSNMPNLRLINEKDLITKALNNLGRYGWIFKQEFTCKKEPHFICVRNIKKKKGEQNNIHEAGNVVIYDGVNDDDNFYDIPNQCYEQNYQLDKNDTYTTIESKNDTYTTVSSANQPPLYSRLGHYKNSEA